MLGKGVSVVEEVDFAASLSVFTWPLPHGTHVISCADCLFNMFDVARDLGRVAEHL